MSSTVASALHRIACPLSHTSTTCRPAARVRVVVCASAEPLVKPAQGQAFGTDVAAPVEQETRPSPRLNLIPKSRWQDGIPPVMGAHLMPSGSVAPISTSKGPGVGGVPHLFHYPTKECNASVLQFVNAATVAQGVSNFVKEASKQAIKEKGSFTLVLSGGSLIKALEPLVGLKDVDYSKWFVLYVDERNVPHSSADSNHKGAAEIFLNRVPIPKNQILAIAENLPVEEAAKEYEGRMLQLGTKVLPRNAEGLPVLDVILLGVGPDGHVASLFPNSKELSVTKGWVLPITNSPKPPPERITFTLPVINAAKEVLFVAFGSSKAEIVQRVLEVQALPGALPAQLVQPSDGNLRWLLDTESAQHLKVQDWQDSKSFPRSEIGKEEPQGRFL